MVANKTWYFIKYYFKHIFVGVVSATKNSASGFLDIVNPKPFYQLSIIFLTLAFILPTNTVWKVVMLALVVCSHIRYVYSIGEWQHEYRGQKPR